MMCHSGILIGHQAQAILAPEQIMPLVLNSCAATRWVPFCPEFIKILFNAGLLMRM